MPKDKSNSSSSSSKSVIRPALTPENAENQCISLAMDLVRQRLIDGTASSQETTHFLKLGCRKARVELEKLEADRDLAVAKKEQLQSQKKMEELYSNAIAAMRGYAGQGGDDDEYDDEY